MTVEIGDIVRCVLSYTVPNGSVAQNVFFWENSVATGPDATLLAAMSAWCNTTWGNDWDGFASDDVEMILVEVDLMNGDGTVARNIGSDVISHVGALTHDTLAPGIAAYMQAETERTKSLGKKYIPGLSEDVVTDGVLTAGGLASLALLFATYIDPITWATTAVLTPGVLSRVTLSFQEFIGSGYLTDVPAYQRRRKPNVGS